MFKSSNAFVFWLIVVVSSLAEPSATLAQSLDNVTIAGRVTDQNGAVIPGATATATLVATGIERIVVTDGDGRFRIIQLEPGVYNLKISFANFATEERVGLMTIAGQVVQLDIVLLPPQINATAVVSAAEAPLVDTTRTVVGGTVTQFDVESLPVASRSPLDLIFTLPGVSEEALSTRDLAEDAGTSPANTPEESGTFSLSGGQHIQTTSRSMDWTTTTTARLANDFNLRSKQLKKFRSLLTSFRRSMGERQVGVSTFVLAGVRIVIAVGSSTFSVTIYSTRTRRTIRQEAWHVCLTPTTTPV